MDEEDFGLDKNEYMKYLQQREKEMFKIDVSRTGYCPLPYNEFIEIFGEPTDDDMFDMKESYFKHVHMALDLELIPYIIDGFSLGWIQRILEYCVSTEEYELCAVLKEHIEIYQTFVVKKELNINTK